MMSDRERWIVYPLLFLAIGFGLKSQWPESDDLQCRSIRCRSLIVDGPDGAPRVRLGTTSTQSGKIWLYGATRQLVVGLGADVGGTRGMVQTWDSERSRRAILGTNTAGGFVRLYGEPGVPSLLVGHEGQHEILGVLALNEQGKPLILSTKDRSVLWGLQVPLPRTQEAHGQDATTAESTGEQDSAQNGTGTSEGPGEAEQEHASDAKPASQNQPAAENEPAGPDEAAPQAEPAAENQPAAADQAAPQRGPASQNQPGSETEPADRSGAAASST